MIVNIIALLSGLVILGADQFTKYYVSNNFNLYEERDFLNGFINFNYIRNNGGAWGMLSNNKFLLLTITILIMFICIYIIFKYGRKNRLMLWAMVLVLSGGLGNLIDRIFRKSVVDFLQFEFFPSFPIFNIADCAIVVGACLLILYFILDTIKESKYKKQLSKDNVENENNK